MKKPSTADIFETIVELDSEDGFESDFEEEWESEVNRKSREYIRWVQNALNRILGLRLAVDGDLGSQTRAAIRGFQQQHGLAVDGTVGANTEQALIAAGAALLPGSTSRVKGQATLADLDSFSKSCVQQIRRAGRELDCADLAIEIWIRFGEQYGIPVSFQYFDTKKRKYTPVRRNSFRSVEAFVRFVQVHVGAVDLIRNTYEIAGGHRAAVAGDVFLWKYFSEVTGRQHRWGHTQVIQEIYRGSGGSNTDQITIVEGSLPTIVPRFETLHASHFYKSHPNVSLRMSNDLNARQELHTRVPAGNGPRRFKSFQNLR